MFLILVVRNVTKALRWTRTQQILNFIKKQYYLVELLKKACPKISVDNIESQL